MSQINTKQLDEKNNHEDPPFFFQNKQTNQQKQYSNKNNIAVDIMHGHLKTLQRRKR